MSELVQSDAEAATESERTALIICYILQAVGTVSGGIASIIAVIISHIRVNETHNAFIRSHHRWLIRTFWFGLLWSVVSFVLIFAFGIGILGFLAVWVWLVYRVVRGVINYTEKRPMPD